jgi:geranylgeranyl diphosphate synthase type II
VSASSDLHAWLDARRVEVERALDAALPASPACPSQLADAMRYSLLAGGKRLRPMLALAAAEATDPDHVERARTAAMPAACALELIHTYSLVHDDLPAMDDDTLRRGRPTNHVVYGEGLAILAGDGLLTEAFVHLAREPREVPGVPPTVLSDRKLRALQIVAEAAGACGMVGGQAIDLAAAGSGASFDAEGLRGMHARKTGALIRAAAASGAVMAGATEDQLGAIEAFARELGLAFQIVDDILDVEGAAASLGKTAGKDAAAGKPTYPALYGVPESRALAAASVDRGLAALHAAGIGGRLPAIADWVLTRTS